ncbi:hypothetical protein PHYBLDRAFT_116257 [Phycomyces blakesleeanus NRRL 1555(-)]|uniref:Enoyl reductase (ER) domain-containing protein n=1 Tax=Phycomyces blakesleeanus (strain ATCC 8743b / DSM 1359 / FGSC 10004 / NBRC 33097 / NRRL 1555) TaxID=763407 RepID=A0A162ZX86_PHYB8|nr:hypothetical protein PHYBLDRAFT_116257 [Phycomyces blakesleeanus NRRL 1555(-)]OAD69621.1 hypothetical protein PHYBLDRAFT_116257 [Phycomyces blakesleeanus NRRL 1555(-)]|eukprot:XP_018287661.1 hypothetical protein PHYBLDRAFT_116257 [Phycomyces blakesleeanus NRRL 1555(-)]
MIQEINLNFTFFFLNEFRDVWILKGMYPGIKPDSVVGADGVGVITTNGIEERVLLNSGRGWDSDERGPEGKFGIIGLLPYIGTLAEAAVVNKNDLVKCPAHLTTAEAASVPLAGLTAYRAVFTKGQVRAGDHVLVTGIGGGVALFALQFAVAAGATVYVTSSSQDKINRAIKLGAKGGINYKDEKCIDKLKELLGSNLLSAVIDGAGGSMYGQYPKVMRTGGIISNYGQTVSGKGVSFSMMHVLKNIDIRGSTLGSRKEFREMVDFIDKHKIKPVVSFVWHGLSMASMDSAIEVMRRGDQFGKLVIEFDSQNRIQKL